MPLFYLLTLLFGLLLNPMLSKADSVMLKTELGDIEIQLHSDRAPETSAYFRELITQGNYDGATIYRAATLDKNPEMQIVQGGMLENLLTQNGPISANNADFPVLKEIESTEQTGLTHRAGTVSFARDLLDTGYVIPDIFICLRACLWADAGARDKPDTKGFPAFGTVTRGLDVLQKIASGDTRGETTIPFLQGQILTQPIRIESARVISD